MAQSFKNQLIAFLKSNKFNYTSSGDIIAFNSYSIQLNDELEYATIYNPGVKGFYISIPYQTPNNVIAKARNYFSIIDNPKNPTLSNLYINHCSNSNLFSIKN